MFFATWRITPLESVLMMLSGVRSMEMKLRGGMRPVGWSWHSAQCWSYSLPPAPPSLWGTSPEAVITGSAKTRGDRPRLAASRPTVTKRYRNTEVFPYDRGRRSYALSFKMPGRTGHFRAFDTDAARINFSHVRILAAGFDLLERLSGKRLAVIFCSCHSMMDPSE